MEEINMQKKLIDELNDLIDCKLCPTDLMDTIDEYLRIEIIKEKNKRNKKDIKDLLKIFDKLSWYDLFVDYIYEIDSNKYNQACEYADKEMER